MVSIPNALKALRPNRHELLLFALLWLKFLVFFTLVLNSDRLQFSLRPLNDEIFRSLLRPAYFSVVILLLLAPLNALDGPGRRRLFLALNLLITGVLLVDLWHYRAFRVYPSIRQLSNSGHFLLSLDMIRPFLRWYDGALGLDLLALPLLGPGFQSARRNVLRLALQAGCYLGLFFLIAPLAGQLLGSTSAQAPLTIHDSAGKALLVTPLGYHAMDVLAFLQAGGSSALRLSPEERGRIGHWLERNREALPPGGLHGACRGRSVLVIQVESLEQFVVDLVVNGQEVTPTLNALRRQGLSFSRYHEQVNRGTSADGDLMTNASVYPLREDPTFSAFPFVTLPSLPRALARVGYGSLALHPDKGSVWNCSQGLRNLGFERCLDSGSFDCRDRWGIGLSDASYLAQARPMISALRLPSYVFMVTQSSHMPFELPPALKGLRLDPALEHSIMGKYLQSVHYTDQQLGRFLDGLRHDGVLQRTLLVVTGDHQGVHKYYDQELRQSPLAEPWWQEPDKRLPLLMVAPGLKPREIELHAGQVDIAPTVLDLLGLEPERGFMGRSLVNTRRDLAVLVDGTLKGRPASPEEARHCAQGLVMADRIIRGNYFRTGG